MISINALKAIMTVTQGGQDVGMVYAWANFSGVGSGVVRHSFNISAITKNATGQYTLTFADTLPDTNYLVMVTGVGNETNSGNITYVLRGSNESGASLKTTTQCQISVYEQGVLLAGIFSTAIDSADINVIVLRNLI